VETENAFQEYASALETTLELPVLIYLLADVPILQLATLAPDEQVVCGVEIKAASPVAKSWQHVKAAPPRVSLQKCHMWLLHALTAVPDTACARTTNVNAMTAGKGSIVELPI